MFKHLITGDIHNRFNWLNTLINKEKPDDIRCAGDFGYWPKFTDKHTFPLSYIKLGTAKYLKWIDGNHEDFWSLNQRESDEMEPGIIYMPRGSYDVLPDGRTILYMGGAASIDKAWRTMGIDWFPEETITQKDLTDLPDIKVDIIISHTCPVELVEELQKNYPDKPLEPSNYALTELWNYYNPSLWVFGHWHQYLEKTIRNTKFYCLSAPELGDRWWMWLPN